ncbi:MAG: anti-sigma factor [Phycisphaerales bacterium]|nr:anti-sigma factor [Phycisphaerales bacterium]MDG1977805.1 anti-sigma factor [Phycisphaerales bacterium]MDG2134121.1 anti-sigma factor [Phycisphaerales bacterium]
MNDFTNDHSQGDALDHVELPPEELFNLLSDRAVFGLDDAESERLEELLQANSWVRADCLDETAAELATAFERAEPMPAAIADRIRNGVHDEIADAIPAPLAFPVQDESPAASGPSTGWLGWVAAAAAIAFAVIAWQPQAPGVRSSSQLVSWVDNHPDAVRWDWAPGLVNPAEGVTGYVTFSPESQEGYMLIKGLEPNDPRIQQYQLWIWDQEREPDPANPTPLAADVHPVDGGVFDVNDRGEVVVPIKLPLRVDTPYLFAVTVERPGGVVKSDKSSVPLIAGPPASDA